MRPIELANVRAEAAGFAADRLERIHAVLAADVASGRIPGAVSLVARDGKLAWHDAVGARDPKTGAAMTRDAIFRIYSMSKPITSLAIMMLVEEGRLLISDPASKFIPAFKDLKVGVAVAGGGLRLEAARREMTVHDLLRHTSGLIYGHAGETPVHRAYREAGIGSRNDTNEQVIAKLASVPLAHQPGEEFDYSISTDVLGRIVEVVSGESLDAFVRSRITGPLGMTDTGFEVAAEHHQRIAEPGIDPLTGWFRTNCETRQF